MGDKEKWKDTGHSDMLGDLLGKVLGKDECVINTETGEIKDVYVSPNQKVGEAIEKGQFTDKPTSDWKK